jgi:hypothetical protein
MAEMTQIQHISGIKTFTYQQNIIISVNRLPNDKCIRILSKPSYGKLQL